MRIDLRCTMAMSAPPNDPNAKHPTPQMTLGNMRNLAVRGRNQTAFGRMPNVILLRHVQRE